MRENHSIISRPTVADIINFLGRYDPLMPFRIQDPDTGMTISIIESFERSGKLWFTGSYEDMISESVDLEYK